MNKDNSKPLTVAVFTATVLPWQIGFYAIPIVSYVCEAAAFAGWGLLLVWLARSASPVRTGTGERLIFAALALLAVTATLQLLAGKIVWPGQLIQLLFFLAVAALVLWGATLLRSTLAREQLIDAWAWSWLIGSSLGVVAALVQYTHLEVPWWLIAPSGDEGRIFGNVHQPNQFATLLAMGLPCAVWLYRRGRLSLLQASVWMITIAGAVVLTASRTGLVELLWIVLWLFLPMNRSPKLAMVVFIGSLAAYGLFSVLDLAQVVTYFNGSRLPSMVQAMSVNDSRLQLWRDVLALISQNPWAGIGFGQLEFFRSFSDLPNAMKTIHVNAHMLPLQIAVEYGLPVAGLFFGLLAFGFFKAGRAWRDPVGNFALANIVMILLHSMTEFPLWYAFILLPFAFLLGLYLASGRVGALQEPTSPQGLATFRRMYTYAAVAVVGGIVLSVAHYLPTIAMYVLHSKDITREDRLATANRAFLYKHWIVYNAIGGTSLADISQHPELLALFDKSSRFYMNEFNMAQYALALAENGEDAKAARVVFALRRIESSQLADLRAYCAGATTPGARRLLDLIDAKAEPTVTAKDF